MQITFYSFGMAVIWSNFIILLLYILRKRLCFLSICQVSWLILFYFFCMLRSILPFELFFTKEILSKNIYTKLVSVLSISFEYKNKNISVGGVLLGIWIEIALLLLLRYLYFYYETIRNCHKIN